MRIKFFHKRVKLDNGTISSNGGTTTAYQIDDKLEVHGYAKAWCHNKDHFCKYKGRVKAEGRLKSPNYYKKLDTPIKQQEFLKTI